MSAPIDLYGAGLSFPVRVAGDGRLAVSAGELNVRESLCILMGTNRRERVERGGYGCGLDEHLYQPNSLSRLRLIQEEIKQAVGRWEPRVTLDDVRVMVNPDEPRAVDVTIAYTLVATGIADRIDTTLRSR